MEKEKPTGHITEAAPKQEENAANKPITIGCLVFEKVDQIDFTGPFEVLSRLPNVVIHVIGKTTQPVRDVNGLIITPEMAIADAPALDLLHVPGGLGEYDARKDEEILSFIRDQFNSGRYIFSVCTGALLCGAAGILSGMKATTYWATWDLLPYYGAIPVKQRVVQDKNLISCAGVTAGIDGALEVAAILCGTQVAERIQLQIEYAPEPRFHSGTPEQASAPVLEAFYEKYGNTKNYRENAAREYAARNGINTGDLH